MVSYVLDTMVISELRKDSPQQSVMRFLGEIHDAQAFLSVITIGEIADGIGRMPAGARRTMFAGWFLDVRRSFSDRILPVDEEIAEIWGRMSATVHRAGGKLDVADGLIAATALANDLTIATRNVRYFRETGVPTFDPWDGNDED